MALFTSTALWVSVRSMDFDEIVLASRFISWVRKVEFPADGGLGFEHLAKLDDVAVETAELLADVAALGGVYHLLLQAPLVHLDAALRSRESARASAR